MMRITYDREANAAYIYLVDIAPGKAVQQKEIPVDDRGVIVLDFDASGYLLGVEILGADSILPAQLRD
jgi:uncharacterized protein YuzE